MEHEQSVRGCHIAEILAAAHASLATLEQVVPLRHLRA